MNNLWFSYNMLLYRIKKTKFTIFYVWKNLVDLFHDIKIYIDYYFWILLHFQRFIKFPPFSVVWLEFRNS